MGGYGGQPMLVIKANRALLKKRKFKTTKDLLLEKSGKTELEFKKVSPHELLRIKKDIREEQKKRAQIETGILIASFAIATALIIALHNWMWG